MKSYQFPYLATPIGLLLLMIATWGGRTGDGGATALPLLTLLMVCEFGAIVTAIATWLGFQHIRTHGFKPLYAALTGMCAVLAVRLAMLGFGYWPST
ncbi:MAG: hypothetical protein H6926_08700 [Chromatiales bacterium]|nr:hypothetical protein [Gammaproteobacteria bacterium]MCP5353246.1 hypothetical protein [Chromatiales bacterium]